MIRRDEITGEYLGIQCSEPGCLIAAPPPAEIMAGHGLNNMGWWCFGGTHYCPEHSEGKRDARTIS